MNGRIFYTLYDESEYNLFIKDIERIYRTSKEYKIWLRDYVKNRDTCAATGLTYSQDNAKIEIHHYGKTLYGIVETIVNYFINEDIPLSSFYICMILYQLHIDDCIDYVPIIKSLHDMIHENYSHTIELYPSILEKIHYGKNKELIPSILNEYKILLKKEKII
jgi:hypothetical protein